MWKCNRCGNEDRNKRGESRGGVWEMSLRAVFCDHTMAIEERQTTTIYLCHRCIKEIHKIVKKWARIKNTQDKKIR
jgi:hypothetical protein